MVRPRTSIPTLAECLRLMESYRMLPNIRDHSLVVARISTVICQGLSAAGLPLALELTIAGALLHDIGKSECLHTPENHAARGRTICLAEGLDPAVAAIVDEHVVLKNYAPDMALDERVVVHYADKRVNHDQVVSLKERLAYILDRYGKNDTRLKGRIHENFNRCLLIEQRIFSHLAFTPAEIAGEIAGCQLSVDT